MRTIDLSNPVFTYDDSDPEGFRSGMMRVGPGLGASQTGISVYELPPGQAVCPYHYEYGEEEWAMPLDGVVTLRDPDGEHQLAPMQLAFFQRGPEGAHQLRNDGDEVVRVLMFGAVLLPTASVYPDSDKIGVWTGNKTDDALFRRGSSVEYFTDQPGVAEA
jgi:uncharacterized cupin superfamily protein